MFKKKNKLFLKFLKLFKKKMFKKKQTLFKYSKIPKTDFNYSKFKFTF